MGPNDRSLCNPVELGAAEDIPCRRSDNGLQQDRCICISTDSPHTLSDRQDTALTMCGNTISTSLVQEVVVAQVVGPIGGGPDSATIQNGPVTAVEGAEVAQGLKQSESGGLETLF